MKNYIDINRQQKLAERNNYKSAIALFHYDYKIERAVQYETLAKERVKNEQALKEREKMILTSLGMWDPRRAISIYSLNFQY